MRWRYSIAMLFVFFASGNLCAGPQKSKREFKLEADSKEFWALIDPDAQLTTVATGFGFTEGPVWDSEGFVFVSDEETNKIFRVYMDGRKEDLISLGGPGRQYLRSSATIDRLRQRFT